MSTHKAVSFVIVAILLNMALVWAPSRPAPVASAADPGIIAYVRRSTHDIHLISPDGSGDRVLWTAPRPLGTFPPYELAWRPDGRELAFSSEHEQSCSNYESDVYAVSYYGGGYRRVTNSPACAALASLPKGSVTVNVTLSASPMSQVYVQGAPGAKYATNGTMTFDNVADFGPGVLQPAVGIHITIYSVERMLGYPPYADVQPGKTVFGGTVIIPGSPVVMYGAGKVSWKADGAALAYGMRSGSSINQIPASPPYGSTGEPLPVVEHTSPNLVAWGPTGATRDLYLYFSMADWMDEEVAGIYLNSVGDDSGGVKLVGVDPSSGENVHDIEWLHDASGFLFSITYINLGTWTNIFRYDFGNPPTLTQVTNLPDDQGAGGFSISPDGREVVFEWVPDMAIDNTSSLWITKSDGSGAPRWLANDAGRPAWGQTPAPLDERVYLPLVIK